MNLSLERKKAVYQFYFSWFKDDEEKRKHCRIVCVTTSCFRQSKGRKWKSCQTANLALTTVLLTSVFEA